MLSHASTWLIGKRDDLIEKKNPFQLAVTAYTLAKASSNSADSSAVNAKQLIETLETLAEQSKIINDSYR